MQESSSGTPKILITGGTSGLGLELVRIFLKKGSHVVATGRRTVNFPGFEEKFSFYKVDFSDLEMTAATFRQISESHKFDIVVSNAGILSPPTRTLTKNGMEYTFQVNFLAHLLSNELLVKSKPDTRPMIIASVTSPVYRLAKVEIVRDQNYRAFKVYSDSKLYLALMCSHLAEVYSGRNLVCFSFDPGVFGSGIYRMRGRFFTILYRIAAPFMRKPSKVARALYEILTEKEIINNTIYDVRKHVRRMPVTNQESADAFWNECHEMIRPFLQ